MNATGEHHDFTRKPTGWRLQSFLSICCCLGKRIGHPACQGRLADVATVALFSTVPDFRPKKPHWPDRDRFVLSAATFDADLFAAHILSDMTTSRSDDISREFSATGLSHCRPFLNMAMRPASETLPVRSVQGIGMPSAGQQSAVAPESGSDLVGALYLWLAARLPDGRHHRKRFPGRHLKLNKLILFWRQHSISSMFPVS